MNDMLNYSMTKRPPPKQVVTARFKEVTRPPRQFFKQWRKHRGMTLEQAAPIAGMTPGNLSAMERREQGYTAVGLEGLAKAYQRSPGWLLEVNPLQDAAIGPIWDRPRDAEEQKVVEVDRMVVKASR